MEADSYWIQIFKVLIPTFFAYSITTIYGTLLTAAEKLKQLNLLFLGGVIINISLNFILIPSSGALGASISTIITEVLVSLGLIYIALRTTTVSTSLSLIMSMVGFILFLAVGYIVVDGHIASLAMQVVVSFFVITGALVYLWQNQIKLMWQLIMNQFKS